MYKLAASLCWLFLDSLQYLVGSAAWVFCGASPFSACVASALVEGEFSSVWNTWRTVGKCVVFAMHEAKYTIYFIDSLPTCKRSCAVYVVQKSDKEMQNFNFLFCYRKNQFLKGSDQYPETRRWPLASNMSNCYMQKETFCEDDMLLMLSSISKYSSLLLHSCSCTKMSQQYSNVQHWKCIYVSKLGFRIPKQAKSLFSGIHIIGRMFTLQMFQLHDI